MGEILFLMALIIIKYKKSKVRGMNYPKERFAQLIKDGFNYNDFISDPDKYQQCGGCMTYYS